MVCLGTTSSFLDASDIIFPMRDLPERLIVLVLNRLNLIAAVI